MTRTNSCRSVFSNEHIMVSAVFVGFFLASFVVGGLFFRPLTPTLLTPTPLPTGILYSPQFLSHQETKMATRRKTIDIYDLTEK